MTAGAHCRASKAWIFARLMLLGRRPDQRHVFLRYEDMSPEQQATMKDYMSNVQVGRHAAAGRWVGIRQRVQMAGRVCAHTTGGAGQAPHRSYYRPCSPGRPTN